MKVIIIDNYDSFTYNLFHLVNSLGANCQVVRNNCFKLEELEKYDKIILSPGPGIPREAGLLMDVIKNYAGKKPILGVCLGHQAIGESFGSKLVNLSNVFHGIQSPVDLIGDDYIFKNLPKTINVGRYHSWVVDANNFSDSLEIIAKSQECQIMALRHKELDIRGIQFHPESVLTPDGKTIIKNWVNN